MITPITKIDGEKSLGVAVHIYISEVPLLVRISMSWKSPLLFLHDFIN